MVDDLGTMLGQGAVIMTGQWPALRRTTGRVQQAHHDRKASHKQRETAVAILIIVGGLTDARQQQACRYRP